MGGGVAAASAVDLLQGRWDCYGRGGAAAGDVDVRIFPATYDYCAGRMTTASVGRLLDYSTATAGTVHLRMREYDNQHVWNF